jgi:hypothetical protein
VSTTHHPISENTQIHDDQHRPARCLRHHVWMAACPDCHDARVPQQRVQGTMRA